MFHIIKLKRLKYTFFIIILLFIIIFVLNYSTNFVKAFDESQKDGVNQIWIDVYTLIEFLRKNTSKVYYDSDSKEYIRKINMIENLTIE